MLQSLSLVWSPHGRVGPMAIYAIGSLSVTFSYQRGQFPMPTAPLAGEQGFRSVRYRTVPQVKH
jgi:hypothetical protein